MGMEIGDAIGDLLEIAEGVAGDAALIPEILDSADRCQNPPAVFAGSSSGFAELDRTLGGGYPRSRSVEIFGPESSGKTTLALHGLAAAQRSGAVGAWVDVDRTLDRSYAARIGVRLGDLLLSEPDSGEAALGIVQAIVESGVPSFVVLDSITALVSDEEAVAPIGSVEGDPHRVMLARAWGKLAAVLPRSSCTAVFLNRCVMGRRRLPSAGPVSQFMADVRVQVHAGEFIFESGRNVGIMVPFRIVKHRLATPYRSGRLPLRYAGIS